MGAAYATVKDLTVLWRPLTPAEAERAEALLPLVSDELRQIAHNGGRDMDVMLIRDPTLESVAKIVTVDIVGRVLRQNTTGEALSQESQTAMGYNWQGTYAIPGGGIANAVMNSDLKKLGLLKQRKGVIELYDPGCHDPAFGENADRDGCIQPTCL